MRNSQIWTAASRAAVVLCALTGTLKAQTGDEPRGTRVTPVKRTSQAADLVRSDYFQDISQIKNATLESESVFFERLEKQNKIEVARILASEARQGLLRVRRNLYPVGVDELLQSKQEIDRANEPLEAAARNIAAAQSELRQYHSGASPEALAIAAGQLDAVPMVTRTRRHIRAAERALQSTSLSLVEGQKKFELARAGIAKLLESLPADDPQRTTLTDSNKNMDTASAELAEANAQINALVARLGKIRRDFFPECPTTAGPVLGTPQDGRGGKQAEQFRAADRCETSSIGLLNKSGGAIDALDDALAEHAAIQGSINHAKRAGELAVQLAEQADAIANPVHDKIRRLDAEAVELLTQAESKLSGIKRILTEDSPGETTQCSHCGKLIVRTRKVVDPACSCVKSNEAMRAAEESIRQARLIAEQINDSLGEIRPAEDQPDRAMWLGRAIKEVRGDKGVLEELALALERGEEFRNQQFDFYPGESSPPELSEMPKRDFPPMVASYVARVNWHYPTYFEDMSLERYGHNFGCLQPAASYGKFLFDLAFLPYNMTLDSPWEVLYTQGLYRPGDCVPHLIYLPRPDCHAAIVEAMAWTGLSFLP